MPENAKAEEATRQLLARLWQRNLPLLRERLDLLDAATASARAASLPEELRQEAGDVAHKLAGSLGMFGYPTGTDIARQIEFLLDKPQPDPAELGRLMLGLRTTLADAL